MTINGIELHRCERLSATITRKQCQTNRQGGKIFSCGGCPGLQDIDVSAVIAEEREMARIAECCVCNRTLQLRIANPPQCARCFDRIKNGLDPLTGEKYEEPSYDETSEINLHDLPDVDLDDALQQDLPEPVPSPAPPPVDHPCSPCLCDGEPDHVCGCQPVDTEPVCQPAKPNPLLHGVSRPEYAVFFPTDLADRLRLQEIEPEHIVEFVRLKLNQEITVMWA